MFFLVEHVRFSVEHVRFLVEHVRFLVEHVRSSKEQVQLRIEHACSLSGHAHADMFNKTHSGRHGQGHLVMFDFPYNMLG